MAHAASFGAARVRTLATSFWWARRGCPVAPLGSRVWGLTIHSSRRRLAARLNSGVRPWWSKCVGGCRFGEFAGVHAVGSGQQSSPLLVAVSLVLRLGTSFPRCARRTWLRWHHAPRRRWASSVPQAVAHSAQAAVLGSMVAPSNLCGHSLPNNSFKPKLLRNSA